MLRIRSLVERVRRLEEAVSPRSPIELMFGSLNAFEAEMEQGIKAGKLCHMDAPVVLRCIRSWHGNNVYSMWSKRRVWEHG